MGITTVSGGPRYDWVRLTHPRGEAEGVRFDAHGWFVPVPWRREDQVSTFLPLGRVRDEPVVLLVSASGAGKTTALEQEHAALMLGSSCLVNLNELRKRPDPVSYLSAETAMPAQVPEGAWHVLLDSFDEALKLAPNLVGWLDQWLRQWTEPERGKLRLRIATRPGVQENDALKETLEKYFPDPGSVVERDMAPLTRDDVLAAAGTEGIRDPEGFVMALEQRGLVPVASIPVLLRTLLDGAAAGAELPSHAEDVYRQACQQLCGEPNPGRRRPKELGLHELVRAAGHLAATLEFCGTGVLTASEVSPDGPVRLVDVAFAAEPSAGGHAEHALEWLTGTPLLRSLSDDQWQFAHQGIQAFLAAEHLKDRELAAPNVQSLLFAGPDGDRYVHPRHRDAAGWLAWHRPEVLSLVLERDPAVLLSPSLPTQPPPVRARVVDALFSAPAGRGAELLYHAGLHRVSHPDLGRQLAEHLTPAAARQATTQRLAVPLALAIARACPDQAPPGALLDVAEDDQVDGAIRASAINSLPGIAIEDAAARLDALTAASAVQVSQAALLKLWPRHLATADLLTRAPAEAPVSFWRWIELNLGAVDVDAVITWIRRQLGDETTRYRTGTIRLITWLCTFLKPADGEDPQQPAALLADVLVPLLRDSYLAWDILLTDARDTWASDTAWRRLLAGEVLTRLTADNDGALAAASQDTFGLVPQQDIIYWARKAADDTTGGLAVLGDPLRLPYPGSTPELADLKAELPDNPRLTKLTARWFAPAPAWQVEAERAREENTAKIASLLERLLAERPESGQVRAWWLQIVQVLYRNPDQYNENFAAVHLDLTTTPSVPASGSPLREALLSGARYALVQAPMVTAGQSPDVLYVWDACEVTALSLLDGPPSLTPEKWAGLALVLVLTEIDAVDQEPRQRLLALAVAQAGDAFVQALPAALSALSPPRIANVMGALAGETDLGDQVNQAVLAWVNDPAVPAAAWRNAVRQLAPHDRASLPVLNMLAEIAGQGFPADGDDDAQHRWAQAADLLLLHGPADSIPARWTQVLASPEATRTWAQISEDGAFGLGFSLYANSPIAYWPAAYQLLTPQQARQLYDRLTQLGMVDIPRPNPVVDISGPGRRGIHNRLPELIAQHLTDAAAHELRELVNDHPEQPGLQALAAEHERHVSENLPPLTLDQLTTLTRDRNRRIVRDITELTQVVLEAINTLQDQALRSHGWSKLMWNRADEKATDGWWPTWEDNLSNLIWAFLQEHLRTQKPVINREVEIQPPKLEGGRTDILVQAQDPDGTSSQPLTVIIEVKGCWNPQIKTGIGQQLARYLQPKPGWAGIFLIGFFHQEGREHENYKKGGRSHTQENHTPEEILRNLQEQIASAPAGTVMYPYVLQLPLIPPPAPTPSS